MRKKIIWYGDIRWWDSIMASGAENGRSIPTRMLGDPCWKRDMDSGIIFVDESNIIGTAFGRDANSSLILDPKKVVEFKRERTRAVLYTRRITIQIISGVPVLKSGSFEMEVNNLIQTNDFTRFVATVLA